MNADCVFPPAIDEEERDKTPFAVKVTPKSREGP